jgi:hypothetical protein
MDGSSDDDIVAGNPPVTNVMQNWTFNVPGAGSTMEVRVLYNQNSTSASEELALDNIIVRGTAGSNQAPVLANIEAGSLSYAEGAPAVNITNTLTVTDGNDANISSAQVRIVAPGFDSSEDRLLFTNQNGITGAYDTSTGILALTGSATKDNYRDALRSVQYQNIDAGNASTTTRTVSFTVTDPAGATSAPVTRDITITTALDPIAALPFIETFETDGEGTRYASNSFFVNGGTQFLRTQDNPRSTTGNVPTTFSNIAGSWYWFGENAGLVDNPAAVDNGTLTTRQISANGFTNLSFSIRVGASSTGAFWQTTDYFKIYYRTGGSGAWTPFASWRGTSTSLGTPGVMRQDANPAAAPGSTAPTGTPLSPALGTFNFPLPASLNGQTIEFQLVLVNTSSTNDLAFDQIEVTASPAVTTAAATSITATSAVLGGNVTSDGGATVSGRGVVYSSTNNTPTIGGSGVTQDANGTGTGSFSETVSGLTAGTTYYVRAYAINSAGTSYGSVLSFTTPTTITSIVRASPNPTNAATVQYTVTFGSSVTGLSTSNFSLSGSATSGASISSITGSGATYTVTVTTGSVTGTLTLNLANATNLTPGISTALPFAGETYDIDKNRPVTLISSSAGASGSSTGTSPIPFSVTFSESVTGFIASDVTVGNGTLSSFSGSGSFYTFNVTPAASGSVTVNVPANVAQDAVGNLNTAATQFTITYNPPSTTVSSVTRLTPSPTATTSVSYRVVFAASVTGLTTSNFSVTSTTGASVASVAGSGTTYTVTVNTGTGNGTLTLNVANSVGISPTVSNVPYTSGQPYTIIKNFAAAPQLSLRAAGSATNLSDVTAFVDLVQVVQSGTSTTVANALQNGSFETNNVPAGSFLYGGSVVAAPWTFDAQSGVSRNGGGFDPTAPAGDAVALLQSFNGNNGSVAQTLAVPTGSYQVNFVTAQRGNNGPSDQVLNVFLVEGANNVFVGTIQPTSTSTYQPFTSAAFSVTAPALTTTISSTASNPTSTSPIPVTVNFSQAVTGFTASDVVVTNGAVSGFAGSGTTYTFNVTPAATGSVTVNVPANAAVDANNTGNTAATQFSIQFNQLQTAAPVVNAPANGDLIITATPTYTGTAPANSTVTVYVDGSSRGTTTASAGGTWSLTQPTALAQGSHTVYATAQLSGQTVSANSNTNTFTVDSVRPSVTVSSTATNPTSTSPIPVTVTFSEGVTGFVAGDVTVTNGTISGFAGSGTTYTFNVTPAASGSVTVNVPANVAQDGAGNLNTAASLFSIQYNQPQTAAPVVITPANGSLTNDNTPTYTGTAPAGSTVTVIVDGSSIGTTTATGAGIWALTQASALSSGSHTVYATAQLSGQAVSANSNTNTFSVDTTPPVAPVVITPANGSQTNDNTPIYSGTAEPNSTVTVIVDGSSIGTTTASGAGNWSRTQATALADGSHTVRATATDAAGNTSPSSNTNTFIVDTTPPAAPVVNTPANGATVATATPTYTGTAEPGSTVTVIVDGSAIGTATAAGAGNWNLVQPSALALGSHTVRATATDAVGNTSPSSSTNTFTVTNPAVYSSSTADQPNTGRVAPGSTNQAILRVAVTIGGGPDSPLSAQSFSFTTTGTTSAGDIDAARVFYTGTSSTFATSTPFGSAVANPNGAFTVSGTQQLSTGVNYFWLVYDVDANAPGGNVLDATVPSLTISGSAYSPTNPAPAGSRQIIRTSRVPGQALNLPVASTSTYVDFANNGVLLNGSYTQEAWIKLNLTTSSTEYYVLGNGLQGSSSAAPFISITGNGRLQAGFGTGTGSVFDRTSPNTLVDDQWNHVVATYNEATDLLLVYLNGEQVLSISSTTAPNTSNRVNYVGAAAANGTFFPGEIDEISQWNRALTVTEIRQLRRLIRTGAETGLVSYLQFNDSGTTTTDAVSNAVGTLMGSATRITSTVPVGYGTSNLQTVAANGTVDFSGTNASITFAGVGGSSQVVVSRLDGPPSGTQPTAAGLQRTFVPAYWIIDEYGTLTFNNTTTVTYTLSPTDISPADQTTPSNLKLFVRGGNSDQAFGTTLSATSAVAAAGTVTYPIGSVANFGQTVIGTLGTSPLPVELTRFTAELAGEDGLLRWTTAQEKSNAYFEVESSVDGRAFRSIGRVLGHGTSSSAHDYQLLDRRVSRYSAPRVYYRLRQVDEDGTPHYSGIVTLQLKAPVAPSADVFPNPAADQLTVRISGLSAGKVQGLFYDAQGRLVQQFTRMLTPDEEPGIQVGVQDLPSGVYSLRLILVDRVVHRTVVIRH